MSLETVQASKGHARIQYRYHESMGYIVCSNGSCSDIQPLWQ